MKFFSRPIYVTLTAIVLIVATLIGQSIGQQAAPFYLSVVPGNVQQNSVRIDTSVAPNRLDIGAESSRLGTASQSVNILRCTGAIAGSAVGCSAVAGNGGDAAVGITFTPLGTGVVRLGGIITTNRVFLPATEFCKSDNVAVPMVATRVAQSDWALAVTSAAGSTQNLHCSIPSSIFGTQTTASKGIRIDSLSVSYFISTNNLTSQTWNAMAQVVYANNVANAISNFAGVTTCALATATQANPYLTACVVPTPAFIVTANTGFGIDFTAVLAAAATTYRVYGIEVGYSTALY